MTELERNASSAVVLVSSCDAYQDVWHPFFTLFFRYWPDCPFPVYLISNHSNYPDNRVIPILVGEDRGWATNTRMALSKIPAPYIIYLQEDYLLDRSVNTKKILELIEYMQQTHAGCLRLYPCPGPDVSIPDNEEVGIISQNAEYRVSLQAAIWDKKILESLLINGETAWHMEILGTLRSRMLDAPFYSVKSAALAYFCTAVVRGKWKKEAIEFCDREGIKIDLSKRPIEGLTGNNLNDIKNLIDSEKFKEAELALAEARAQDPNSPDLLNLQSVLKIHMGDNEGAKAILFDLIKRLPTYFPAYNNLALLLWDGGDIENAVRYFEEALRISNFDRSVVLSYGDMLFSHKKYAKAKELYVSFLKTNPNDPEIRLLLQKDEGVLEKVRKLGHVVEKIK